MKLISSHAPSLREEIKQSVNERRGQSGPVGAWQDDFLERLLPYATAGKLLRGCLLCFSYEAFSGQKPGRQVVRAAAALELIHSALLIHDDVMDNDNLRRGKPAMHRQYAQLGRRQQHVESDRFGANMAICGADLCIFMAFGLLADQPAEINRLFSDTLIKVCAGQMQDVCSQPDNTLPSKRSIYGLMRAKTASYSLSLPLAAGAVLAEQKPTTINKLRRIGDAAGIIFQIRDDELGVLGSSAQTGKPVGADIREGKKTLIYHYLMKTCSASERCRLNNIIGNQNITANDIIDVQKFIRRHKIPRLLNTEVRKLEEKALNTLGTLNLSPHDKTELKSLIAFCAKRQA